LQTKAITKPFGKWPRNAKRTRDRTKATHLTVIMADGTKLPKLILLQLQPL
jgi:hypothetical protein